MVVILSTAQISNMTTPLFPIAVSSQLDVTGKERVHAAREQHTTRVPFVPLNYVYVLMDGTSTLLRSSDGGQTWPDLIDSGGSASSIDALFLDGTGNRLTRDQPISGRTSTDGSTFETIGGALSGTGFPMWHLWTGDEWLRRSAGGMRASTDGVTYSTRTIPGLGTADTAANSFAKLGSNIIFHYRVGTTDYLCLSNDNGLTWSSFNFGQAITQLVATANKFLAFVGSSGAVLESPTGASGTWFSAGTLPSSVGFVRMASYNEADNVLVVVNGASQVYISYDEGVTWENPLTPFTNFEDHVSVRGLVFAYNNFILVHRNTSNDSLIYTSPDGVTWTLRYTTSTFLGCIAPFEEI